VTNIRVFVLTILGCSRSSRRTSILRDRWRPTFTRRAPPSQSPPSYPAIPPVYYPPLACCGTTPRTPVSVPEPASATLLLIGILGVLILKRAAGDL
jgi:hypothetical protein